MTTYEDTRSERATALDPVNFRDALKDAPRIARHAISLALRLEYGELTIRIPDGREFLIRGHQPGPKADFRINDYGFASRLVRAGDIGFAEAYIDGLWDSSNVTAFLELFCRNRDLVSRLLADRPLTRLAQKVFHWFNRNTRRGARKNIEAHYDLGNAFYRQWLDDTVTYSSALFDGTDRSLDEAQTAKYRSLAEAMDLRPGASVLEVGCGWGGFAEFAAREYGARVTGITISREQLEFARNRMQAEGLSELVEIRYQDYRDTRGEFDNVASIEMFEAVGERYWPVYFDCLRSRLKAGGRAALQVITIRDELYESYRSEVDFIQRYVFPGGMLPSPEILRSLVDGAGFTMTGVRRFGLDYAHTLAIWRNRFFAAWPDIQGLGFDTRFRRLWAYYLSYCEAGFRSRNTDVCQIAFTKP